MRGAHGPARCPALLPIAFRGLLVSAVVGRAVIIGDTEKLSDLPKATQLGCAELGCGPGPGSYPACTCPSLMAREVHRGSSACAEDPRGEGRPSVLTTVQLLPCC